MYISTLMIIFRHATAYTLRILVRAGIVAGVLDYVDLMFEAFGLVGKVIIPILLVPVVFICKYGFNIIN